MKKGLKITKSQLEQLYLVEKLSLNQIGKKFDCDGTNILYWMKKYNIERRPPYRKKIDIPEDFLYDLYWNKKLSSLQIGEKLNIDSRVIRKKLKKFGIKTRSLSEAGTRKFKKPFDGGLKEKAYLIGLRAGDFHVKKIRNCYRIQTSTTHIAQKVLLKKSFNKYGEYREYYSKNNAREDEWFIYVDIHKSFKFLLKKPNVLPEWIFSYNEYFFQFLAAYFDCEGSIQIQRSHKIHKRYIFRICSGDKIILEQIREKLSELGFYSSIYLNAKKGTKNIKSYAPTNIDIYQLTIYRKKDILKLFYYLYPLVRHSEKIRRIHFILSNLHKKWDQIHNDWGNLKNSFKQELLKNQPKEKEVRTLSRLSP